MPVTIIATGETYPTVSAAIAASRPGDTIAIPAGTYVEQFPLITHSLALEGSGGLAHLRTPTETPANGRAILMVPPNKAVTLAVRNLEFSGAHAAWGNGAGILFEGGNPSLTVTGSYFHDNEEGILAGGIYPIPGMRTGTHLKITGTEFARNGLPATHPHWGYTHNIYLGGFETAVITNNYFHDARGGHEIKSRALRTTIADNLIADGTAETSYSIDLPNGGVGIITGNTIEKGPNSVNRHLIHFGGEPTGTDPASYPASSLLITNNTLINRLPTGATAILNHSQDIFGAAYPVTARDNTLWNVEIFATDRLGTPQGPRDTFTNNTLLFGTPTPRPPWQPPWVPLDEPGSAALLAVTLFLTALFHRALFHRTRNTRAKGHRP